MFQKRKIGAILCVSLFAFLFLTTGCRSTKYSEIRESNLMLSQSLEHHKHVIDSLHHVIQRRDSASVTHSERDSSAHSTERNDSLLVKDSAYIKEFADGSRLEQRWHIEWRWIETHDTLWRERESKDISILLSILRDSICCLKDSVESVMAKTDTLLVYQGEKEKVVIKNIPWWKQMLIYLGEMVVVGLLAVVATLVVQRRRNRR